MSSILIENPCEGVGVILDPECVTIRQKEWLTNQMTTNLFTPSELAKKYNLDRKVLKVWSYRYRQGMRRRSVQGRPRVLDRLALEEVKIFLGEDSDNVDDIAGLKRVLNEGYRDTKRRCERGTDDSDESDESDDGRGGDIFQVILPLRGSLSSLNY